MFEEHEPQYKPVVNSCDTEELAITAPLATPVVLILNASFPQK